MPYMAKPIHEIPKSILTVFLAVNGDDSPIVQIVKDQVCPKEFEWLINRRDEWRENALRAELQNDRMSSAALLYELGGNAASLSDRNKAGLGAEVPVHVRPVTPSLS